MAKLVREERDFLRSFKFAGRRKTARVGLLKNLSRKQVLALIEIGTNALLGVLPLNREQKKVLSSIKDFLRLLACEDTNTVSKKKVIVDKHAQTHKLVRVVYPVLKKLVWDRT